MSEAKIKGFVFVAKYKQDPKVLTYSFAGSTINDYLLTVPVVDYDELQNNFSSIEVQLGAYSKLLKIEIYSFFIKLFLTVRIRWLGG